MPIFHVTLSGFAIIDAPTREAAELEAHHLGYLHTVRAEEVGKDVDVNGFPLPDQQTAIAR